MATFEVVVEKTVWVSLEIEADTKEEAEKFAREQIVSVYKDKPGLWNEYYNDPGEITYEVIPSDKLGGAAVDASTLIIARCRIISALRHRAHQIN